MRGWFGKSDPTDSELQQHFRRAWGNSSLAYPPVGGRSQGLPTTYSVVEFAPPSHSPFSPWVYSTFGLSPRAGSGLEMFLECGVQSSRLPEILNAVAHFHCTGATLGLHHIVNLGEPWLSGSACTYAYFSLPYRFGPSLEWLRTGNRTTRCLQLVPITAKERALTRAQSIEKLELAFDRAQPVLSDARRRCACE